MRKFLSTLLICRLSRFLQLMLPAQCNFTLGTPSCLEKDNGLSIFTVFYSKSHKLNNAVIKKEKKVTKKRKKKEKYKNPPPKKKKHHQERKTKTKTPLSRMCRIDVFLNSDCIKRGSKHVSSYPIRIDHVDLAQE